MPLYAAAKNVYIHHNKVNKVLICERDRVYNSARV